MSTRPPPLRASDRPPTYRMVTRVYSNSLRPVVIVMGSILAIWSLIPAFQDISEDKDHGQPKLAVFDIVLGVIYATSCAIEVFGIIAAAAQRLALVRLYAMLSIFTAVAIVGSGFIRVVIHFVYKDGLISECISVVQGDGVEFRFGIWGPRVHDKLNQADATTFCNNAWNRDSLDEILSLIFEIIFSIFFIVIAWAYYHQVLDPTSAANVSRAPANFAAGGPGPYPYPDHYNRPYDTEAGAYNPPSYAPYQPQPQYAPPPGPPPTHAEMGYGVGTGAKDGDLKGDNESEMTKFDDPFADFDGPSKPKSLAAD
ncbi:hypothetical protein BD309DRAFT_1028735 [Dichomitus squalens]|nr:hypothetical protein BD309DRAFT_1028735 [Dichomitus squalens]